MARGSDGAITLLVGALLAGVCACGYPLQLGQDARILDKNEVRGQAGVLIKAHDLTHGNAFRDPPIPTPWIGLRVGIEDGVDLGVRVGRVGADVDVKALVLEDGRLRIAVAPRAGVYLPNPFANLDDMDFVTSEDTPNPPVTGALSAPMIVDWQALEALTFTAAPTIHLVHLGPFDHGGTGAIGVGIHLAVAVDLGDHVTLYPECSVLHVPFGRPVPDGYREQIEVFESGQTLVVFAVGASFGAAH